VKGATWNEDEPYLLNCIKLTTLLQFFERDKTNCRYVGALCYFTLHISGVSN